MNLINLNDEKDNPSLITPFSIIHYLSGLFLFFTFNLFTENDLINFIIINIIHFIYECKDYFYTYIKSYDNSYMYYLSSNNTLINSVGDTIFFLIGIYTALYIKYNKYLNKKIDECKFNSKYIFFFIFSFILLFFTMIFYYYNLD